MSSNTDLLTVSPSVFTFTTANRNQPQTVTLTAPPDDTIDNPDREVSLAFKVQRIIDIRDDVEERFFTVTRARTMTIVDNDPTPTSITLSADRTTWPESITVTPESYSTWLSVTASIDGPSTLPRPVTVTVNPGNQEGDTAIRGVEYRVGVVTNNIPSYPNTIPITIPAGSDSITRRLLLTIIDNNVDEPDRTFSLSGSTSGLTVSSVTLTIEEDDTRGVTVSKSALSLGEVDDTRTTQVTENVPGTYTVVLDSEPTGTVTITASIDDISVARLRSAPNLVSLLYRVYSLTFTPDNWNTPQTVTVTPVDDTVDNPNDLRLVTVRHTLAGDGTDYGINNVSAGSVAVTVGGDNEMRLILSKTTMAFTEGDEKTQDTYTVKLSGPPRGVTISGINIPGNVAITINTSDASVATVDGGSQRRIFFTPSNWNTPQTVTITVVDDDLDNPNDLRTATINSSMTHSFHRLIGATSVAISVTDNETRGVAISETALSMREAGGRATYTIKLTSQPTRNVTVTHSTSDDTVAYVLDVGGVRFAQTIVFTPSNWDTAQTVRVTGVNDSIDNPGDQRSATITHTVSSDGDYGPQQPDIEAVSAPSLMVTALDDDTRGVTVERKFVVVSEVDDPSTSRKENEGSYRIKLNSEPTGTVTISNSGDDTAVTLKPSPITFDPTNWNQWLTVTVTAVDDTVENPGRERRISIRHVASGADYDTVDIANTVPVQVRDNEISLTISISTVTVAEEGGTIQGAYTVSGSRLGLLYDLPLVVDVSDSSAALVNVRSEFGAWLRTIDITPIDDDIDNGEARTVTLTHRIVDGYWNSVNSPVVTLRITDDEEVGVSIAPPTVDLPESGTATYAVKLTSEPTGTVTVTPAKSDSDAGVLSVSGALTFDSTNWNQFRR